MCIAGYFQNVSFNNADAVTTIIVYWFSSQHTDTSVVQGSSLNVDNKTCFWPLFPMDFLVNKIVGFYGNLALA